MQNTDFSEMLVLWSWTYVWDSKHKTLSLVLSVNSNTLLVQLSKWTERKHASAEKLLSLLENDSLCKVKTKTCPR